MPVKKIYKNSRKIVLLKSVSVFTSMNFLSKGISFLLLFIYTQPRFTSPEENGILNLFSSSLLFLMPLVSQGILHSASTDIFKLEKKRV
jgi:O-antigen/teichoic acid export membrane protein